MKKYFGLNKNIFFAGITSLLTDISTKMIYSIMPLFLLSIGASKTELSLIEGIAESTASLLKAVSGYISDKIGKNKVLMLIGYGMTAIITPIYSLVVNPIQVLILRFIERVGKGVRTAPRDSLIAAYAEENKTGRSFGFHKAMDNCGAIVGPLLAYFILLFFNTSSKTINTHVAKVIFLIAGIPAILGILVITFYIKDIQKNKEDLPNKITHKDFSKRYYFFLLIIFVFTLGNSTDTLLLVKASDIGFAVANIPLLYLVFNVVSVIFAVPAGSLSDKIGRENLIILGYFIYSVVYFGFGMTNSKITLVMLFVLYGLYSASTDSIQKALVSDLTDKNKKGTALGIYNSLLGITLLPASLIAGTLYDKVNNQAPFYFGSIMALTACVLMIIFKYSDKKIEK